MRLKLFLRRLTISAPRMAVRSALPWPLRWIMSAVLFGFCAAIALWAFEFGKGIAGLESGSRDELLSLRTEVTQLRESRDKAQSVANTADSLLTAEKAAQAKLTAQIKQLEADNRSLRDDLGFFEKLIPSSSEGIAIRGLSAELVSSSQARWQVLVIQAQRNAAEFNGRLEVTFSGLLQGKPWSHSLPSNNEPLTVKQYRRMDGVLDLPPNVVLKTVSVRILQGNTVRATQSIKL